MYSRFLSLSVYFLLISHLLHWQTLFSDESPQTGTLVVTYQTDRQGKKLDRIRFWLKNEAHKQWFFPKGAAYVQDPNEMTRMVVIENLPSGPYTLEFLVPNTDQYFEEVATRRVMVTKGEVTKIDQIIKPRDGQREIGVDSKKALTLCPPSIYNNKKPVFFPLTLSSHITSSEGRWRKNPLFSMLKPSLQIVGKLIVSYNIDGDQSMINKIRFSLMTASGQSSVHPTPDQDTVISLKEGYMVMIPHIPVGVSTLDFFIDDEGKRRYLSTQRVTIAANTTESIHQSFTFK